MDLLIKNGRTVDGKIIDVAIDEGKIVYIGEEIFELAEKTIDLNGKKYLSAGWIDDHVHCFEKMDLYYDFPDEIGITKGATTIIDAGSTGSENIGDFYKLAKQAKTNVYGMLNISRDGIIKQDELSDLTKVQCALVKQAIENYPDFIVGIKARISKTVVGLNGVKPLHLAKKIQAENKGIPLMVHIGSAPPELSDILSLMEKGDILTHCFHGKPNGILNQETDTIKDCAWDAYGRGVCFDIGHGTDSFNFHVAEVAKKEGMVSTSISTDIYHRNRKNGPVYDLVTTMEKLLTVGYSLPEVIHQVTSAPAKQFHLQTKGELKEGFDGDLTIFDIVDGEKELTDSNGQTRVARKLIQPIAAIVGGKAYECK